MFHSVEDWPASTVQDPWSLFVLASSVIFLFLVTFARLSLPHRRLFSRVRLSNRTSKCKSAKQWDTYFSLRTFRNYCADCQRYLGFLVFTNAPKQFLCLRMTL